MDNDNTVGSSHSLREEPIENVIPPDNNGYNICGYVLPEDVLENILVRMPREEVLNCNLVCRAWNELIARKSFWKQCFEYRGLAWNNVPALVKEKGCAVLNSQLCHEAFTKNYILNPSGHRQFETWSRKENNRDGWIIEEEPKGCDPLPNDPFFGPEDTSCFVTTYYWCSKQTIVDLWATGLNPVVMKKSLPFQIKCSQVYVPRFDCGGIFHWNLQLCDSKNNTVRSHNDAIQRPASMEWETAEYSFKFKRSQVDFMDKIRYLVFEHKGKDTQFWAGHYGMKFARACVTVQCLESDPETEEESEKEPEEESDVELDDIYGAEYSESD